MTSSFDPAQAAHRPNTSMSGTLRLANAQLVLPDTLFTGAITIEQGRITDISAGGHVPEGAIDCDGDYVLPGLIELHTDNLERHMEPRPEVYWPHLPALIAHDAELASTGITTVFDAMRAGSIHGGKARYRDYARTLADDLLSAQKAGLFKINHFLHLRAEICSQTLLEELARFTADDCVGIVSLMDHTPGQRQFRDMDKFKTYVTKKRGMSDAEFADHFDTLMDLQQQFGAVHEAGAVAEAARLGAVLASHDDTTSEHVTRSAENGVQFAEFPTTLEAAQTCRDKGLAVMMGAPNLIRGGSHSGNVAAIDLARADLLDIVSSDYIPAALLQSAFKLAEIWQDMPRAAACVTANPAKAAGLTDRGALEIGLRGDVIRVRTAEQTPIVRAVWNAGVRI